MEGLIKGIYIAPKAGAPMQSVQVALLQKGSGIVDDRYQLMTGAYSQSTRQTIRHLTLIELESIILANGEYSTEFTPEDTRRNILTVRVRLNELVGQNFHIGPVLVRGIELCEPCDRPSKLCMKVGFKQAFNGRGGLRVEVLESGLIGVDMKIYYQKILT